AHRRGGGGAGAETLLGAIDDANRRPLLGAVARDIFDRERAGAARIGLHSMSDVASDITFVEGVWTIARDCRERVGERWVGEDMPNRPRLPLGIEEIGARFRREAFSRRFGEFRGKTRGHREGGAGT